MGNTLQEKGELGAAIESYKQAIKIKPDYADAYSNMGSALKEKGEFVAAIESYKQAIKIKPDFAEAYSNMGNALKEKGELGVAIESYKQAIKIKPDYANAYSNIGAVVGQVVFTSGDPDLQQIIISLLNKGTYVRPRNISKTAISLLKFEPLLQKIFEKHSAGELAESLQETISGLSDLPLLLKLMIVCPIPDLKIESLLKDIRTCLLLSASEIVETPEVLRFQSALALQCFTNEYVYSQTNKEANALEKLEYVIEEELFSGIQPTPQSILCLASYKALQEYKWCKLLTLSTHVEGVFTRQIFDPKEEARLKPTIPALQKITDKVSSRVREQYEGNPYPRWVNLGLTLNSVTVFTMVKKLNLRLCNKAILDVASPNILIAGCGTGQHSIETASTIKNSKVLGVDLSLPSLAYAKRKTEELGLQNLEYMQADILDLEKLDRKFDIIESSGVLHHMDKPMAGWKILTNCLSPGGLMKIGLYSEIARQNIVEMRNEINQLEVELGDNTMRSFRNTVINSEEEHHKQIFTSLDFYSLSTLRDLLFHVQEHRFSMPQIKTCLDELGLKFCGFESKEIVSDFKQSNPDPGHLFDLDKWHSYEEANPNKFLGMYQFWCQKIV